MDLPPPPPYTPTDPNPSILTPLSSAEPSSPRHVGVPFLSLSEAVLDGPSHQYANASGIAASVADGYSPSMSNASEAILTPPSTPGAHSEHGNNLGSPHDDILSSSEAYFESRPSIVRRPSHISTHKITISPSSTPSDIPFPVLAIWRARDVNGQDWATFLNHLFPNHLSRSNIQILDRKIRIEQSRSQQRRSSTGSRRRSQADELMAAQLENLSLNSEKAQSPSGDHETELARRERLESIIAEWNEGFFLPRGLKVVADIQLLSRRPVPAAQESEPLDTENNYDLRGDLDDGRVHAAHHTNFWLHGLHNHHDHHSHHDHHRRRERHGTVYDHFRAGGHFEANRCGRRRGHRYGFGPQINIPDIPAIPPIPNCHTYPMHHMSPHAPRLSRTASAPVVGPFSILGEAARYTALQLGEAARLTSTQLGEAARHTSTQLGEAAHHTSTQLGEAARHTSTQLSEAARRTSRHLSEAARRTSTQLNNTARPTSLHSEGLPSHRRGSLSSSASSSSSSSSSDSTSTHSTHSADSLSAGAAGLDELQDSFRNFLTTPRSQWPTTIHSLKADIEAQRRARKSDLKTEIRLAKKELKAAIWEKKQEADMMKRAKKEEKVMMKLEKARMKTERKERKVRAKMDRAEMKMLGKEKRGCEKMERKERWRREKLGLRGEGWREERFAGVEMGVVENVA